MYYIDKKKTFLKDFDESSQITYSKIGKIKALFWLISFLIIILILMVPSIVLNIALSIFAVATNTVEIINEMSTNPKNPMLSQWINVTLSTGINILSFFIYIKLIEKRPFKTIGLKSNKKLIKYLKGVLIAILMQLIYFSIILISGFGEILSEPIYASYSFGISAIGPVLMFLIAFIIQGASEEVAIRGWILPVLSKHYKPVTAIIISSLFFGILHALNPNVAILPIINLILYGIFASLYALYDDGLWGIFAQHSIWNWFMGNVLGLPVSGMIIGNSSIIETKLTGPTWITGGDFGPEGGIIVTIIFTVSSLILIKLLINKGIIVPKNKNSTKNIEETA